MRVGSVMSYFLSAIFLGIGFYKMFIYETGYDAKNAYVGGDAYNYIINANYATAFFVLAILCAVIGATFVIAEILTKKEEIKESDIKVEQQDSEVCITE